MSKPKALLCTLLVCAAIMFISYLYVMAEESKYSDYVDTTGVVTKVDAVVVERISYRYRIDEDKFNLSYSYTVDGAEYYGSMISDTSVSPGTMVRVSYDPYEPALSRGSLLH